MLLYFISVQSYFFSQRMQNKTRMFYLFLVIIEFLCNFANKLANLLHLGIKKKRVSFVLHSIFRNFAE